MKKEMLGSTERNVNVLCTRDEHELGLDQD